MLEIDCGPKGGHILSSLVGGAFPFDPESWWSQHLVSDAVHLTRGVVILFLCAYV